MAKKMKKVEGKKGLPAWMASYSDLVTLLMCFFVLLFAMSSVDADKFAALADSFGRMNSLFPGSQGLIIDSGDSFLPIEENIHPDATTDVEPVEEFTITVHIDDAQALDAIRRQEELLGTMAAEFRTYFADNHIASGTSSLAESGVSVVGGGDSDMGIEVLIDADGQFVNIIFPGGILFDSGRADLKPEAREVISLAANILQNYTQHMIRVEGHTDNVPQRGARFSSNRQLSAARAITIVEYLENERGFDPRGLSAEGMSEYWPRVDNDTPENRAINRRVEIKVYSQLREGQEIIPVNE
jgi:chemotaxis protein MotB